jgi:hypothetical protein
VAKKRSGGEPSADGDEASVNHALKLINQIPPWDPALGSTGTRGALHKQLKDDIKPLYGTLERLQAQFIPEGSSSGPLACTMGPRSPGTPVSNFLTCYDLCVHCQEEAKRALLAIRDALNGRTIPGPFLSSEEKFARAKQYEAWARSRADRDAKLPSAQESFDRLVKGARTRAAAELPVLTEDAAVFRDILVERGPKDAVTGPKLCEMFEERTGKAMDEAEFRTSVVPLLKAWGAENKRKVGYFFPSGAMARLLG